jgi:hypothetical protein
MSARTAAPRETTYTAPRKNRYPGPCVTCGARVDADAGLIAKTPAGWKVSHVAGECPAEAPAAPAYRQNRYAAPCAGCGGWVEAGEGRIDRAGAQSPWRTSHAGPCPVAAPVGIYRDDDGTIWRVRDGRGQKDIPAESRRRYAARLTDSPAARENEAGDAVRFDWERDVTGTIYRLTPAMLVPLDDEQVKALMIATGQCIACDASLYAEATMRRVRETGIMVGPVCRGSFAPANAPAEPEYTRAERPA